MSEEKVPTQQERDIALIKKIFGGDDHLVKVMRAVMLGLPTTDEEKKMLEGLFADADVYRIVRARFLPELDRDVPMGTMTDAWQGVTSMIFDRSPTCIKQAVAYKDTSIQMTQQALGLLRKPFGAPVDISYSTAKYGDDELQVFLLARNQFISHIDTNCSLLYLVGNADNKEKAADIAKNIGLDSAR